MESITLSEIEQLYAPLFKIGALGSKPEAGFFRPPWSTEEQAAFDHLRAEAEAAGLIARYDAIGNLFLEQPGYTQYVECGSHLDTVDAGGNYDGAAGVITGLAAIRAIMRSNAPQSAGLRLRIWRGEESAVFDYGCKGSRAAFANLPESALETTFRNETLAQAITRAGFDSKPIATKARTITQDEINGIRAHVELHIEQANFLEQQSIDIGVVNSIRGPSRLLVTLEGRFDHSGGTSMGTDYRRDANLALGYIMVEIDQMCQAALRQGNDLVQTIGIINSSAPYDKKFPQVRLNATAKVSGFAYFTLDIRSNNKKFRDDYVGKVEAKITEVSARFNVKAVCTQFSVSDPCESLDAGIQAAQHEAAKKLGYSAVTMPCGANHDCVFVAEQKRNDGTNVPIGMIFIPCREGISHSPDEYTTFEAITKGANVLALTLSALAK